MTEEKLQEMLEETWKKTAKEMTQTTLISLVKAVETRGEDQKWLLDILNNELETRKKK